MSKLRAGSFCFDFSQKTIIMGILNSTPDSFSDGGKYTHISKAIDRVATMVEDGADMIDVGGESTRPGATRVELDQELERVIPVIEALALRFPIPISIDTYKAEVASQALTAGAHMINDVWAGLEDPQMLPLVAEKKVPIILMHNRKMEQEVPVYQHLLADICTDLRSRIAQAQAAGVGDEQIIIDPGIGFAKTYEHNLQVMAKLEEIVQLGYPVLLGTSRKSLIAKTLQLPPEERVEGTIATVCLGITKGVHMVRVHDVQQVARAVKMLDVMLAKEDSKSYG